MTQSLATPASPNTIEPFAKPGKGVVLTDFHPSVLRMWMVKTLFAATGAIGIFTIVISLVGQLHPATAPTDVILTALLTFVGAVFGFYFGTERD